MIQKHEAIECVEEYVKSQKDETFNEDFREKYARIRKCISVHINNLDPMVDKEIDKGIFGHGEYFPIFDDVYFSATLFIEGLHNDIVRKDVGIFAFSNKENGITNFLVIFKILKKTIFIPAYGLMSNENGLFTSIVDKTYFKGVSEKDIMELASDEMSSAVSLLLFCSKLLSCKNITYVDHEPPAKLNKKRIKNGKEPIYAYKTLEVQLNPKYRKSDGTGEKLDTMPLHICAGHFKEYSAEKPLLGKFVGRYWWQPHMRGNSKNGLIEKDYVVKA